MILIDKIKLRLTDKLRSWMMPPSRVGMECRVSRRAKIISCDLHSQVNVEDYALLYGVTATGSVHIGRNTSLWGPDIFLSSYLHPIKIGNFCSIAKHVAIQEWNHDHNRISTYFVGKNILGHDVKDEVVSKGAIIIGHDVWIGGGSHITSGVRIGNGAVIAAGSVVTKNVSPYAIVGGVPARLIKYRFQQSVIEQLEELKWWYWSHEKIRANADIFSRKITQDNIVKLFENIK